MFRIGGSAGTGITSGLDEPKKMASASTDMDRKIKELRKILGDLTTLYYKAEKIDEDCARIISTAEDVLISTIQFYNKENRKGYKVG